MRSAILWENSTEIESIIGRDRMWPWRRVEIWSRRGFIFFQKPFCVLMPIFVYCFVKYWTERITNLKGRSFGMSVCLSGKRGLKDGNIVGVACGWNCVGIFCEGGSKSCERSNLTFSENFPKFRECRMNWVSYQLFCKFVHWIFWKWLANFFAFFL